MDKLILVREAINSERGRQILSYATEYMIETASKTGANAEWVKGMGMLINHLQEVDGLCKKQFERNK